MMRAVLVCAAVLALVVPAAAQSPADLFTAIDVTSNASGAVSLTADWYRVASADPALQPNQQAGGAFYVVAGGPDVTDFGWAASRWTRDGGSGPIVAGNHYEIRFTGAGNKAADFWSGGLIDVPFQVWLLGPTPDDPADDVRMIPLVLDWNEDGAFGFYGDHQAASGGDDPFSDWIYFGLPPDASPGQAGYDQIVDRGWLGYLEAQEHLARVVLMNRGRHQYESSPGAGDGPADAQPEPGTTFRIGTQDVIAPECRVTAFQVGSPSTFALVVHEPVSGVASVSPVRLTNATVNVPPFTPGETAPLTITGTITDRAVARVELLVTDMQGNTVVCDQPRMEEVAIHDAGNVVLAVQPNGNFGTFGTSFPTDSGLSAFWPKTGGVSHLFAANLWVGTTVGGEKRVMDNHFGPFDWTRSPGAPVTYATTVSDQDIAVTYDDASAASAPIGLRVHQQSFQWADPDYDDLVLFKYTFENTGVNGDLTEVYPAIWADTDIGDPTDRGGYDASRGMVYGYDDDASGLGGYVGIKVLGDGAHRATSYVGYAPSGDPRPGQDPKTDVEKYDLMTAGLTASPYTDDEPLDRRMIVTAPAFDLAAGASHTVVFAVVMGADLAALQANADRVAQLYADNLVDDDFDGVPESVEAAVPNPDGSGTGDGNGDGIPDVDQPNVTSLPSGVDGSYVTFESEAGSRLIGVAATTSVPDPENAPAQSEFPAGFLSFGVKGLAPGAASTVTIYTGKAVDSYWKYGPTPDDPSAHWYEFLYDGTTGAEIFDGRIVVHFVDGQRGDHDLAANGRIQDPGAPVVLGVEMGLASLRRQVEQFGLPHGSETALTKTLDHAARAYAKGRPRLAVLQLKAFTLMARAFARGDEKDHGRGGRGHGDDARRLTEDEAARLVHAAGVVIGRIEASGDAGAAAETDAAAQPAGAVALEQNYPNPFNPQTSIRFTLPEAGNVRLVVYDVLGRQVRVLAQGVQAAGTHTVTFDASSLSTGTYFYRLETPAGSLVRRMTVSK